MSAFRPVQAHALQPPACLSQGNLPQRQSLTGPLQNVQQVSSSLPFGATPLAAPHPGVSSNRCPSPLPNGSLAQGKLRPVSPLRHLGSPCPGSPCPGSPCSSSPCPSPQHRQRAPVTMPNLAQMQGPRLQAYGSDLQLRTPMSPDHRGEPLSQQQQQQRFGSVHVPQRAGSPLPPQRDGFHAGSASTPSFPSTLPSGAPFSSQGSLSGQDIPSTGVRPATPIMNRSGTVLTVPNLARSSQTGLMSPSGRPSSPQGLSGYRLSTGSDVHRTRENVYSSATSVCRSQGNSSMNSPMGGSVECFPGSAAIQRGYSASSIQLSRPTLASQDKTTYQAPQRMASSAISRAFGGFPDSPSKEGSDDAPKLAMPSRMASSSSALHPASSPGTQSTFSQAPASETSLDKLVAMREANAQLLAAANANVEMLAKAVARAEAASKEAIASRDSNAALEAAEAAKAAARVADSIASAAEAAATATRGMGTSLRVDESDPGSQTSDIPTATSTREASNPAKTESSESGASRALGSSSTTSGRGFWGGFGRKLFGRRAEPPAASEPTAEAAAASAPSASTPAQPAPAVAAAAAGAASAGAGGLSADANAKIAAPQAAAQASGARSCGGAEQDELLQCSSPLLLGAAAVQQQERSPSLPSSASASEESTTPGAPRGSAGAGAASASMSTASTPPSAVAAAATTASAEGGMPGLIAGVMTPKSLELWSRVTAERAALRLGFQEGQSKPPRKNDDHASSNLDGASSAGVAGTGGGARGPGETSAAGAPGDDVECRRLRSQLLRSHRCVEEERKAWEAERSRLLAALAEAEALRSAEATRSETATALAPAQTTTNVGSAAAPETPEPETPPPEDGAAEDEPSPLQYATPTEDGRRTPDWACAMEPEHERGRLKGLPTFGVAGSPGVSATAPPGRGGNVGGGLSRREDDAAKESPDAACEPEGVMDGTPGFDRLKRNIRAAMEAMGKIEGSLSVDPSGVDGSSYPEGMGDALEKPEFEEPHAEPPQLLATPGACMSVSSPDRDFCGPEPIGEDGAQFPEKPAEGQSRRISLGPLDVEPPRTQFMVPVYLLEESREVVKSELDKLREWYTSSSLK
eukprot:TRINITY_DN28138_c0_g1_i1.p1 TRINITY_DN28138_c0_g1~~TRINITY_DN28138_c0_g1_i1.p1  ORF type:complete len:1096 (-),score=219.26 TRINITY_DN28138_c0_g1_i1:95-3382(-)